MANRKTIFKKNVVKETQKLVGAYIPASSHEYLVLYTLAKGTNKAKIIKEKVENFIALQKTKQSDDDLLFELLQRVKNLWKIKKSQGENFLNFKEAVRSEFLDKGLNERYTKQIIKELQSNYDYDEREQ